MIQGLGVLAVTGRMLEPSDFTGDPSPLLSSATRCGATAGSDPSIIGRRIRVERKAAARRSLFRSSGPSPEFYFGRDSQARMDLLMPLLTARRTYMVRLREGVPREYAEQRITQAARATGLTPGAASGWNRSTGDTSGSCSRSCWESRWRRASCSSWCARTSRC